MLDKAPIPTRGPKIAKNSFRMYFWLSYENSPAIKNHEQSEKGTSNVGLRSCRGLDFIQLEDLQIGTG